jgi:hypothetical protein
MDEPAPLITKLEEQAHKALREHQKDCYHTDVAVLRPEVWKNTAVAILQGAGCRPTMKSLGIAQHTYYKVKKALFATPDDYRKHVAELAHVTLAINDDNKQKLSEIISDLLERKDTLDAKELLDLAKAQKEMSVTGQIDAQRIQRLEGDADMVIRHERAKTPEELQKDFEEKFLAKIKKAEVIDES